MPWFNARRPWRTAADIFRVGRWAKARGVQVVHCNEHNVYPYGAWLARWLGVPIVCHMRFIVGADFARWAFGGRRAPDALIVLHQLWVDVEDARPAFPDRRAEGDGHFWADSKAEIVRRRRTGGKDGRRPTQADDDLSARDRQTLSGTDVDGYAMPAPGIDV